MSFKEYHGLLRYLRAAFNLRAPEEIPFATGKAAPDECRAL